MRHKVCMQVSVPLPRIRSFVVGISGQSILRGERLVTVITPFSVLVYRIRNIVMAPATID
jgi:hypothetical protein